MKAVILAENLQKGLAVTNKAISTKNQLPILSHVLLEAKGEKIHLTTTDLEIGIETEIPAQIEEEGILTVPARLFLELANSLPQEKILLETTDGSLKISSKKTKAVLQVGQKEEFPMLYEEKGSKIALFGKEGTKGTLGRILFASSSETTRPALSGILFQKAEKKTLIVATDGYRLSLDEAVEQETAAFEKLLIPARLLREAINIFSDEEIALYMYGKNNQIIFEQGNTRIVGRTIDAAFPDFEKVVPTDQASMIRLDREELLKAVKTCAIFAREGANIITLTLGKDKLTVMAKSPSLGENTVAVDAVLVGEENQIAFNARYLLEALSNIQDAEITFSMTGPLNPGVFRIQGNTHFLHLIMPVRT